MELDFIFLKFIRKTMILPIKNKILKKKSGDAALPL